MLPVYGSRDTGQQGGGIMETPLLEIRDVKKYFPVKKVHGKEITVKAVDSINLKINQGEIVGLVGESRWLRKDTTMTSVRTGNW